MEIHCTKIFIFDAWPSDIEITKDEKTILIALTPICAHELASRGFDYLVPEDFCSLDEQLKQSDIFYNLFKKWIENINVAVKGELKDNIPGTMNPVWPFAYHLLNIIDPWFNQLFILDTIFNKMSKAGVGTIEWFGSTQSASLQLLENFFPVWRGDSIYSLFCAELAQIKELKIEFRETKINISHKNDSRSIRHVTFKKLWNRFKLEGYRLRFYEQKINSHFLKKKKIVYTFKYQLPSSFLNLLLKNETFKKITQIASPENES